MNIELMNESHIERVLEMSKIFYSSDALDHEVPLDMIMRNIEVAVSDDEILTGYVFCIDGEVVGFSYITTYYETEVGGKCIQIVDLYVDEKYRGRGYSSQYFRYIFDKYVDAKRFRLEVVKDNEKAINVYKRMGFKEISYGQMVIDKI